MRVLELAACPYPLHQGSQVYLRGTALALARAGHDVSILAYGYGEGDADPEVRLLRGPALPGYRRTRAGPDPVKPLLDLALAARASAVPCDVVHAHNYEALGAALLARARTGTPVVYAAHTLLGEELPSYLARGRRLAGAAGALVDATLPRQADAAIALSRRGAERLRALGCRRVWHIPPGIHPEDVAGVEPLRVDGRPTLVYAGNPDRYQDLHILFGAMRLLPDVRLLLVSGASWDGWDIGGATVVPARSWSEVRRWIAGADVAAQPRALCAGFPLKLLNYLALGVPAVVAEGSAQGLPGEVVVRNLDVEAFAAGVRAAMVGPRPDAQGVLDVASWAVRAGETGAVFAACRTATSMS